MKLKNLATAKTVLISLQLDGNTPEEETVEQKPAEYQWVIDPLDGTTNFVHGIPFYAVSVALLFKGQSVLGVVYEINQNDCYQSSAFIP